jgi:hypothetical protein
MRLARQDRMNRLSTRLAQRWGGAARLDARVFTEVAADPRALAQAALVVAAGGVARGIGAFSEDGWLGIAGSPAIGVVVWLVAAVLAWAIAAEWIGGRSDFPALLRALGFAAAPLIALGGCAWLSGWPRTLWWVGCHLWATLAFGIAVRSALDVSPVRALVVCASALGMTLALLFAAAAVLFDAAFLD